MQDFRSYAGGQQGGGANAPQSDASAEAIAALLGGKGEGEVLRALYKEAEAARRAGKLTDAELDNFCAAVAPMLGDGARKKLEQVVYNLVGNAVNYTGEDKKIAVGLHRAEKGVLRFTVTDTGKGIPEEARATIWDRYYRSAETHKRPIKGTGLGLSIVKTVLLKHGFKFGVDSEVGKGSTFYVLFPEK